MGAAESTLDAAKDIGGAVVQRVTEFFEPDPLRPDRARLIQKVSRAIRKQLTDHHALGRLPDFRQRNMSDEKFVREFPVLVADAHQKFEAVCRYAGERLDCKLRVLNKYYERLDDIEREWPWANSVLTVGERGPSINFVSTYECAVLKCELDLIRCRLATAALVFLDAWEDKCHCEKGETSVRKTIMCLRMKACDLRMPGYVNRLQDAWTTYTRCEERLMSKRVATPVVEGTIVKRQSRVFTD